MILDWDRSTCCNSDKEQNKSSPQFCNLVSHLEFAESRYGPEFLLRVFWSPDFAVSVLTQNVPWGHGYLRQLTLSPGVPGTPFWPGSPFAPLLPSSPGGPGAPGVPFSPWQKQKKKSPPVKLEVSTKKLQVSYAECSRVQTSLQEVSEHSHKSLTRSPFGPGSPFAPFLPGSP